MAANHAVDLRTTALQFLPRPMFPRLWLWAAGAMQQVLADYTSMQTKIPTEFWAELKAQNLIETNAPVPA